MSSSATNCFVVQIDLSLSDKLRSDLQEQGFIITQPQHTIFQAKKKGVSCTLYTSGKLTVQGKEMQDFIRFYLEPELLGTFSFGYEQLDLDLTARIGVDESGKGDFFGPLCIAGVYADAEGIKKLQEIGAKDSKKLSDTTILKIAEKIKKNYSHNIVRINPAKYNELYEKFSNLNLLLGWGHATVIENLMEKTDCEKIIIDQFAAEYVVENALKRKGKKALLTQRTRGEEDLVVAAASILARAAFLEGIEKLGQQFSMVLPKGASNQTIQVGKKLVTEFGSEILCQVGKLHFKTTQVILGNNNEFL